jgi:NAD(P)-dependent dehydrogenase (short-subunit alcohol dehydrogenase family)
MLAASRIDEVIPQENLLRCALSRISEIGEPLLRPMNIQTSDKIVLVAGGTGGLGQAVSLAFVNAGARVVVTCRREAEFQALKSAADGKSQSIEGIEVDVTDVDAVEHLADTIAEKYGRLDALVNTVGGYAGGAPLWQIEPKTFEQMMTLNVRAGYVLSRALVPLMLQRKTGVIINVASRAALDHAAGAAAYAASKAAAVAMMDSLAADLYGTGVRANSILPSLIDTEANRKAMPKADFSKWPKPEEIARVILFLCSDDARLIHGASLPVYGTDK